MAYEYAFVHLKFTIPAAILLTLISFPLLTRRNIYKISILIVIAVVATIPWDANLIYRGVWTYPEDVILGPRLLEIPVEELFFFIIQTYITSLVYILAHQPILHAQYLYTKPTLRFVLFKPLIQVILATTGFLATLSTIFPTETISVGLKWTYLKLILSWACAFASLTWCAGGDLMLRAPALSTLVPILLPTLYLWIVDELTLSRGTWSISSKTKLGIYLWGSLDIEEAIFFLATNVLVTFGLAAFDNALAILDAFPDLSPSYKECPTAYMLMKALVTRPRWDDALRIDGIRDAVQKLRSKSRSFYFASSLFSGRLRIDLVLLYSFCRTADDLIDGLVTEKEVLKSVEKLRSYLDMVYKIRPHMQFDRIVPDKLRDYVERNFPPSAELALLWLPNSILPQEPLYMLVEGFEMDAKFAARKPGQEFPITDETVLERYAACVAGTVGELCVALIFHHSNYSHDQEHKVDLFTAARNMGIALQYVNIARDILVDAKMGRVYLPTTWLKEEGLTPEAVLDVRDIAKLVRLRHRLLMRAFEIYEEARPVMRWLPRDSRGPMIAAVESYMDIGRVIMENPALRASDGVKATVPKWRRIRVLLKALLDGN